MASRSSTWKPKPLPRSKICFFKPSVCDWGLLFAAVNEKIRNYAQNPVMGARCAPDSFSHGYAVPDLRRSACLLPAQRAASSTPSKRELFYQIILRLSNKLRHACRGAHCAPAFCAEFAFYAIIGFTFPLLMCMAACIIRSAKNDRRFSHERPELRLLRARQRRFTPPFIRISSTTARMATRAATCTSISCRNTGTALNGAVCLP